MSRFKFILILLLLAVSFHFFAQSSSQIFSLASSAFPQLSRSQTLHRQPPAQPQQNHLDLAELSQKMLSSAKKTLPFPQKRVRPAALQPKESPQPSSAPEIPFLQVILEDLRPPLKNPHFEPEISALLDDFLARRRQYNADLVNTTENLFGPDAKKEVVRVLIDDERATFDNAQTSQTRPEFAGRQLEIDAQTEQKLYEIFLRHRNKIEKQQNAVSPAWKAFFKRVKNYQRAAELAKGSLPPGQNNPE